MNYLLDRKTVFRNSPGRHKGPGWGRWLAVLLVLVFFVVLANILFGFLWSASKPWWVISREAGSLKTYLLPGSDLVEKYQEAEARLVELEAVQSVWLDNLSELEELRQVFSRPEIDRPKTLGRVLAGPTFMGFDVLLIDVGRDRGEISLGNIVTVGENLELGQVVGVSGRQAMVRMYSSSGVEIPSLIGWESFPAILAGQGNGSWIVTVPVGTPVNEGDPVWLTVRRNLLGVVQAVEDNPEEATKKVYVSLPFGLDKLSWVEIYDN